MKKSLLCVSLLSLIGGCAYGIELRNEAPGSGDKKFFILSLTSNVTSVVPGIPEQVDLSSELKAAQDAGKKAVITFAISSSEANRFPQATCEFKKIDETTPEELKNLVVTYRISGVEGGHSPRVAYCTILPKT